MPQQLNLAIESLVLPQPFKEKDRVHEIPDIYKDLDQINPISEGTIALPHSPVYKMHRYFARRPYSVFNYLLRHYTNKEDIVLDPFCGGGPTIIEGLRLQRKMIGIDINPMATFITKCEAMNIDLNLLDKAFKQIKLAVSKEVNDLYLTTCPRCQMQAITEWTEWSNTFLCPTCNNEVIAGKTTKIRPGKYNCLNCNQTFSTSEAKRTNDVMIKMKINCLSCGYKHEKAIDESDVNKIEQVKQNFDEIVKKKNLWYPKDKMPTNFDLRRPYNMMCKHFYEFLTLRNLLAISILFKEINNIQQEDIRYFMRHIFTSTLSWVTKMSVDPGHGWAIHAYWMPNTFYELNVWTTFMRRYNSAVEGKKYSNNEIGNYYKEANLFNDLLNDSPCLLLTQSSSKLPIPDNSIDAIITDPPYGGNVMYSELCNFWTVWLKEIFSLNSLIDTEEEAIINKCQSKKANEYEKLLYVIFKECYRVLKPKRWLVMTFHNKDSSVWLALLRAAHRAGFYLPDNGAVYQNPIQHYTNTLYQRRNGSVLGDFIYSFQKIPYSIKKSSLSNGDMEKIILNVATNVIKRESGTTTSQIFQELVPNLFNSNILDSEDMVNSIENILGKNFVYADECIEVEKGGKAKVVVRKKWQLKEE
ncbi:MAG: DNA methyltransferase [bacterium]|nr:DNA methyltransferase [bacterium]